MKASTITGTDIRPVVAYSFLILGAFATHTRLPRRVGAFPGTAEIKHRFAIRCSDPERR